MLMYPLREVLFLVVCGTIASGDDYDALHRMLFRVGPRSALRHCMRLPVGVAHDIAARHLVGAPPPGLLKAGD
jgi:hypothetical protein